MIGNYLVTAFRNIRKNPLFSAIYILGLTVGIGACVLILNYVQFEKSYENFIPNHDRIYRLRYERISEDGSAARFASCAPPAAARIRGNYPEMENIGRLFQFQNVVTRGIQTFMEERMFFAEPQFLEIFNFPDLPPRWGVCGIAQLNCIRRGKLGSLGRLRAYLSRLLSS